MANDGKWLEKKLQEALKDFQAKRKSFVHRFPDSRSAGNWLAAQPGDYLWLLPGVPAILLEVKSTEKSAPLRSLLDAGQCGKHRLWLRAGHFSAFVYGDSARGELSWYTGGDVIGLASRKEIPHLWKGRVEDIREMLDTVHTYLTTTNKEML